MFKVSVRFSSHEIQSNNSEKWKTKRWYSQCKDCKNDKKRKTDRKRTRKPPKVNTVDGKIIEKECMECRVMLSLDSFSDAKKGIGQKQSMCKTCRVKIYGTAAKEKAKARKTDANFAIALEKKCGKCKLKLPASAFRKQYDRSTGLSSYCNDCLQKYTQEKIDYMKHEREKAGKCELCGYDKNCSVLEFAHEKREEKARSKKTGKTRKFSKLSLKQMKEERKLVKLLCKNMPSITNRSGRKRHTQIS